MIPFQLHRRIPLVRRPFYQRDRAMAERDAATAERDRVAAERDAATAELDRVAAERNAVEAARDRIAAERDAATAERDRVAAERDRIMAERDTRYDFSADWFSWRIPTFEKYVAPLAGSACALLEIGAYEGRATTWLTEHVLTHPEARLDVVDLHARDALRLNIGRTGRADQVTLHKGRSREILRRLPLCAYDFIYVDGSHSTIDVLEDAVSAFQLAKPGAVIAFDDYPWDAPHWNNVGVPKPAIDAFLEIYAHPARYEPRVEVIEMDYQVWVRKLAD